MRCLDNIFIDIIKGNPYVLGFQVREDPYIVKKQMYSLNGIHGLTINYKYFRKLQTEESGLVVQIISFKIRRYSAVCTWLGLGPNLIAELITRLLETWIRAKSPHLQTIILVKS